MLLSSLAFLGGSVFAAVPNSEDPFIGTWYTTSAQNTLKIKPQDFLKGYEYGVNVSIPSMDVYETCKKISPTELTCLQIYQTVSTLKLDPATGTIEYNSQHSATPIVFYSQPQEDPLQYLFYTFKMTWSRGDYQTMAFKRYNSNTLIVETNDQRGNYGVEPLQYKVERINDDRDKILLGYGNMEGRNGIKHSFYYEKSTKRLYLTSDTVTIICSDVRPCIYEQVD